MASAARFAALIGRRSMCLRPKSILKSLGPNHKPSPALSSSTSQFPFAASRFAPVLGTMLPLHSTIAAARLKSNIAINTTCWSLLSREVKFDL
ncbi:hypothetical protein C2S51_004361 [Perilla frutescens var. frutescens]|nr:hypothetical protein C2S51_004361 [Perilla frutescens var. frutescens]